MLFSASQIWFAAVSCSFITTLNWIFLGFSQKKTRHLQTSPWTLTKLTEAFHHFLTFYGRCNTNNTYLITAFWTGADKGISDRLAHHASCSPRWMQNYTVHVMQLLSCMLCKASRREDICSWHGEINTITEQSHTNCKTLRSSDTQTGMLWCLNWIFPESLIEDIS